MRDCKLIEENDQLGADKTAFQNAHKRIMEISPKIKELVASLTPAQKAKFDKKAEKKVTRAQVQHREKLQKQINELTEKMPPQMRAGLQQTIQRMPVQKQEQYLAEMIAQSKRRE